MGGNVLKYMLAHEPVFIIWAIIAACSWLEPRLRAPLMQAIAERLLAISSSSMERRDMITSTFGTSLVEAQPAASRMHKEV